MSPGDATSDPPEATPDTAPDAAAVELWLRSRGRPARSVAALAGDVSARRYFRVELAGQTAVVATYPPSMRPSCRRFLRSGELLAAHGVPVPEILLADCEAGLALLEDAGRHCLHELPDTAWAATEPYFAHAAELAARISRIGPTRLDGLLPPLDGPALRRELDLTWRLFLEPRGLLAPAGLATALAAVFDRVCADLDEPRARRPCHRDFMARNLVVRGAPPGLVVLDHQDLRLGPPLYDLASLLNDTLFPPTAEERKLVAAALGGLPMAAYHRVAAQRCLKAVGTYAGFARRGDDRHLPLVAPTLERGLRHLQGLPEGRGVAAALAKAWKATPAAC